MQLPPLTNQSASNSLTQRVFQALKQGIIDLDIKPREHLIIGEIATAYATSRTPVREAIIMLEREGWVENDGRRGARVTVPTAEAILEILEIQAVLEGYVVRRVTPILTDEDITYLARLMDEADTALANSDETRCRQLGAAFHTYLVRATGNHQLEATINNLEEHIKRARPLLWHQGEAPAGKSQVQHRAVFEAIKQREATEAERLIFHHTTWYEQELAAALRHI